MAGQYSRELSVFAGQCGLIEHGFRQGGPVGFGLRRLLIDEGRNPKGELGRGDRKSLQTERGVLTPGPLEEIERVQTIYSMIVEEGGGRNRPAPVCLCKQIGNLEQLLNDAGCSGGVKLALIISSYLFKSLPICPVAQGRRIAFGALDLFQ
jgi:hypothetical protein